MEQSSLSSDSQRKESLDEVWAEAAKAASALPCLFKTSQCVNKSALAKKAETLFLNLSDMIARRGIGYVGFVTLTFAENLTDRVEAQRRFNSLATNFLRKRLPEWVVAVERQSRGAIHYHLVCGFWEDIRSHFDFESCSLANQAKKSGDFLTFKRLEREYFRSANPALRAWWAELREAAKGYGFGRCETLPILSNAEGLARYVGAYVGIELKARPLWDKGLRTIRYSLEHRAASCRWSWAKGSGQTWRRGCQVFSLVLGAEDFTEILGPRWAWNWRKTISAFGRNYEGCLEVLGRGLSDNLNLEERLAKACALANILIEFEEREEDNGNAST